MDSMDLTEQVGPALREWLTSKRAMAATADNQTAMTMLQNCILGGLISAEEVARLSTKSVHVTKSFSGASPQEVSMVTSEKVASPSRSEAFSSLRVKSPMEKFSTTKYKAHRDGGPVIGHDGREVELPSEAEHAVAGAYFKTIASRCGIPVQFAEWERDVLSVAKEELPWAGQVGGEWRDEVSGMEVKALLDDTTSGSLEIAPIVVDANVVTFPLLSGLLYPRVNVVDIPRGRRVEGASVSTPTVTWGVAEGSAITPFTTDSLVAPIDTTIHPVVAAVEIGRDFMADSIIDIGQTLTRLIGERLAAELDYVIAVGNGTSQPQGLTNASGLGDIGAPAGGVGTAWTMADVENLYFGVGLQYRTAPSVCFCSSDTTYKRVRAIRTGTGATTYQTQALGIGIGSYNVFELPWCVQNDIPNATAFCGDLKRYRMYRRVGLATEMTTEGRTLRLNNLALLTVRARFGGKVVDASAIAKGTQFQP